MFEKIKKLAMLLALAGTIGTAGVPAASTANAMPRGPVVESEAPSKVHFRHRRGFRIHVHIGGHGWGHRPWGWRRCRVYLRRYRITGRRYWLYRYRRCIRWGRW